MMVKFTISGNFAESERLRAIPYGILEEHLSRIKQTVLAHEFSEDSKKKFLEALAKIQAAARPNDDVYMGIVEDDLRCREEFDREMDEGEILAGSSSEILKIIIKDLEEDLQHSMSQSNCEEVANIAICLGKIEGAINRSSLESEMAELRWRQQASRSKGGKNSSVFDTKEKIDLLVALFHKYYSEKKSNEHLHELIRKDLLKHELNIVCTTKTIGNNLVKLGLVDPQKPKSKK